MDILKIARPSLGPSRPRSEVNWVVSKAEICEEGEGERQTPQTTATNDRIVSYRATVSLRQILPGKTYLY